MKIENKKQILDIVESALASIGFFLMFIGIAIAPMNMVYGDGPMPGCWSHCSDCTYYVNGSDHLCSGSCDTTATGCTICTGDCSDQAIHIYDDEKGEYVWACYCKNSMP